MEKALKARPLAASKRKRVKITQTALYEFDFIPIELKLKILSYLTPKELCFSVSRVCKSWNQLAYDPILWQNLDFDLLYVQPETAIQIITRSPFLKKLTLKNYFEVWQLAYPLIYCNRLRSIHLSDCEDISWATIFSLRIHCPSLENLVIERCYIEEWTINQIVALKKLKRLHLVKCWPLTTDNVVLIANECHNLEEFNIDQVEEISDRAIVTLSEKRKNHLRRLHLHGDKLTDNAYKSLAQCSNLVDLGISCAKTLTNVGLKAIKDLKNLRCLRLKYGTELTRTGIWDFFEGPNMQNLLCLDLHSCYYFDDVAAIRLARCCRLLKLLKLDSCFAITDVGVEAIICSCKSLEMLGLKRLGNITGACLAKVPKCLPNLNSLKVEYCHKVLEGRALDDLKKKMPKLKINGTEIKNNDPVDLLIQVCSVLAKGDRR